MSKDYQAIWMNEELSAFRSSVRRFVQNELVPHHDRWRMQRYPDASAWTAAGAASLLLPDISQDFGGGGGTFAHAAVVTEELAAAGMHLGTTPHSVVAHYVSAYGNDVQKRTLLPLMATGELVGAIAMTEPVAGSDLPGIRTTARREGDHYVIDGSKTHITNAMHAGLICLAVKTDPKASGPTGISMLLVETQGLAGFHVGKPLEKLGQHEQDTCEIFFDGARVPASCLLGGREGSGFFQMLEQLPYERLSIALAAAASIERAVAITTKYVKERKAFGHPLLALQNTRFTLARCKTDAQMGRVFVDHCIQQRVSGSLDAITAAMAKYSLTETQARVLDACLQLHGGYGYMTEYPIARMWADARMQRIGGGTSEIMLEMIGSAL